MLARVDMPEVIRRRGQHVIAENERVLAAVAGLEAGDLERVGQLMNASHASLRDLYEVSSMELDTMAELLRDQPGCYGARLTGAGFGGCCVALMDARAVDAAILAVSEAYRASHGADTCVYPTRAAARRNASVAVVFCAPPSLLRQREDAASTHPKNSAVPMA